MTQITQSMHSPFTGNIRNYMAVSGYTKRCGAPTNYKVQIKGSNRWYRVYNLCFSNTGTLFIRTKDNSFMIIDSHDLK